MVSQSVERKKYTRQEYLDFEINAEEPATGTTIPDDLARRALNLYREAQQAAQAGNWGEYGEKIKELEGILEELNQEYFDG